MKILKKIIFFILNNLYIILAIVTGVISLIKYFKKDKPTVKVKKSKGPKFVDDYFNGVALFQEIGIKIETLDDLIELGESYDPNCSEKYVVNMKVLNRCVPELKELNTLIGMKDIKNSVLDLFFFYFQDFIKDDRGDSMMHTIIEGPPGCGKTVVAKILGKLYYKMGIVKDDKFTEVCRSDFIGKYIGHTEKNTEKIFKDARGGVIFIDEAYSLGYKGNDDTNSSSFAQIVIDVLTHQLTEQKGETVVILAGYKEDLAKSLFSRNKGLMRRFPFRFTIGKYSFVELKKIYEKMVRENGWNVDKISTTFFKKNYKHFPYSGGDMETLWNFSKITHARRVFGKDVSLRRIITQTDLNEAFKLFINNDEVKNRGEDTNKKDKDLSGKVKDLLENITNL